MKTRKSLLAFFEYPQKFTYKYIKINKIWKIILKICFNDTLGKYNGYFADFIIVV